MKKPFYASGKRLLHAYCYGMRLYWYERAFLWLWVLVYRTPLFSIYRRSRR